MGIKIERTSEAILLTLPPSLDLFNLQLLVDQLETLSALATSTATETHLDELVREAKPNWSPTVRSRLASMKEFQGLFE